MTDDVVHLLGINICLFACNYRNLVFWWHDVADQLKGFQRFTRTVDANSESVSVWSVSSAMWVFYNKNWNVTFDGKVVNRTSHHSRISFWTFSSVISNNANVCSIFRSNFIEHFFGGHGLLRQHLLIMVLEPLSKSRTGSLSGALDVIPFQFEI